MKMNRITIFLMICIMVRCQKTPETAVDALFRDYRGEVPGAAVMVIHRGQPILTKTYGLADVESRIPVTPHTNFRLASVTKAFTATAVLMLIADEYLTLDATLVDIFPNFPDYGRDITVRHLLNHTSGLLAYESLLPDTLSRQVRDRDVLALMMHQDSTYFPPGTAYRYSNSGYAVLAMIVEKISDRSFPDFLRTRIFEPLGMSETVAYVSGENEVPNRAYGYTVYPDSIVRTDQSTTSAVLGDGGVYSNLTDMFKWDQALYGSQLLSDTLRQMMFTPNLENYGFGWRIDSHRGHRRIHHTGSTRGFRNCFIRFPDDSLSVIVLTNRNQPESVMPLGNAIAEIYWHLIE
jgi:CubicO group peptidase (beta-lactamase class C family)